MAADKDILSAVFSRMDSYSTSSPIAWPGVDFTPPSSGLWIEVALFPNEPDDLHWASETQIYMGFLQASVYFRPGGGIFSATDEAEGIVAHFPKGTQLGPVYVSRRPYIRPVVTDDSFLFIPVTIPYRGIT